VTLRYGRLAELAPAGKSNKQSSAELFVSFHTVETNPLEAARSSAFGQRGEPVTWLARSWTSTFPAAVVVVMMTMARYRLGQQRPWREEQ